MSIQDSTATDKRDVYRKVTDAIIHSIEQGVGNWRMPWHTSGRYAFSPINVVSKKPYRGINTVCLWAFSKRFEDAVGEACESAAARQVAHVIGEPRICQRAQSGGLQTSLWTSRHYVDPLGAAVNVTVGRFVRLPSLPVSQRNAPSNNGKITGTEVRRILLSARVL
jgi:hypothetical protein